MNFSDNQSMNLFKEFIVIYPSTTRSFEEQAVSCFERLNSTLRKRKLKFENILKLNLFIAAEQSDFPAKKKFIINEFQKRYVSTPQPIGIIAEPPADTYCVVLEVLIFVAEDFIIKHKSIDNLHYSLIENEKYIEIYAGGLTGKDVLSGVYNQSIEAYESMKKILLEEGMTFGDVVRQWNFIENLLEFTTINGTEYQNYQIFNDVRSKFYSESKFPNGYPAATGIGMNCGGVVIDFIARKNKIPDNKIQIIPIGNPEQIDSHKYSERSLLGNSITGDANPATPKFERAKALLNEDFLEIYISGTASIKGELTQEPDNEVRQTEITIENIKKLISTENLNRHGLEVHSNPIFNYIRVYIKNTKYIDIIREVCKMSFNVKEFLFLKADVCRNDLLVEIEGYVTNYKL
ncbi:MAG: Endoribonuclease [Ignavibacteria bacterium]|nr:Endoribonuclease [Ignavibacteria bacterium]